MRGGRVAIAATVVLTGAFVLPDGTSRSEPSDVTGREGHPRVATPAPDDAPRAGGPAPAAAGPDPAAVVARAGSVVVTVGELEHRLARATPQERDELGLAELRRRLARELLHEAVLADEAERRGLAAHPEVRIAERAALVEVLLSRDFPLDAFEPPPEGAEGDVLGSPQASAEHPGGAHAGAGGAALRPDDDAGRSVAREAAIARLVDRLRRDHLRGVRHELLYSVAFELPWARPADGPRGPSPAAPPRKVPGFTLEADPPDNQVRGIAERGPGPREYGGRAR